MDNTEMKKHVCSLINDDKVFIPIATEAFKAIDLDNNNCIDKEEFKECSYQVAKGFGLEKPSEDAIEEIYKKLDLDGNGTIEFEEFKKYVKQILIMLLEEM